MWQGIQYVTSALSLVAFIAAAASFAIALKSKEKARLIEKANPADRTELIRAELEFFQVDTENLTREKQFQVAMEQIRARSRRFLITSLVVCVLGLAFLALAAYAISSTIPQRSEQEQQKPIALPTSANAKPLPLRLLTDRILCELTDLVRDDSPDNPSSRHRNFLLAYDYGVAIHLSLEVNDNGDLAISRTENASSSQTRNFTRKIYFSTRDIFLDWSTRVAPHDCPAGLSGILGFRSAVENGAGSMELAVSGLPGSGAFGQSMNFVVTGNPNATDGWLLTSFEDTSAVKRLSGVKIDRIAFAFAPGPNAGKPMSRSRRVSNVAAQDFLDKLLSRQ
jgi:hypothetical protein